MTEKADEVWRYAVIAGADGDHKTKTDTLETAVAQAIRQSRTHGEAYIVNQQMVLMASYANGEER